MKNAILVPFDGSKNAVGALQFAINLAKSLQEKIIVLNVQPNFKTVHTKIFFDEAAVREYQEQLFEETVTPAKELLKVGGIEYELKLRTGDPKEQICKEVMTDNNAGCSTSVRMIIMGSRGMNPMLSGVLGSVSYGVINSAVCPVTVVPLACSK